MWLGDDTYGTGQHGAQYSNAGSLNPGLPQNAPVLHPRQVVGPDDTIVQPLSPAGLRVAAPVNATTFRLFRIRHGLLFIGGVRSFNAPGEVVVERLTVGDGADISRNATPFDSAAFNTQKCFCPVDWGCSDLITITVRGLVPDAQLNWVVFGTLMQSFDSCYPTLATVEAHAAGLWAMVNGVDPCARGTVEAWRSSLPTSSSSPPAATTRATRSRSSARTGPPARQANSESPRSAAARSIASRLKRYLSAA